MVLNPRGSLSQSQGFVESVTGVRWVSPRGSLSQSQGFVESVPGVRWVSPRGSLSQSQGFVESVPGVRWVSPRGSLSQSQGFVESVPGVRWVSPRGSLSQSQGLVESVPGVRWVSPRGSLSQSQGFVESVPGVRQTLRIRRLFSTIPFFEIHVLLGGFLLTQWFCVQLMHGSFCALIKYIPVLKKSYFIFQLWRVRWMHWWSLQGSIPSIRLRTTALKDVLHPPLVYICKCACACVCYLCFEYA